MRAFRPRRKQSRGIAPRGRRGPRLRMHHPGPLEVESIDVALVEDERRAQHHLVAFHLVPWVLLVAVGWVARRLAPTRSYAP